MTEQPGPRDTGSTGTTGSTGSAGTTIVLGHVVTPTSQTSSQTPGPTHLDIPDGAVAYAGGTIQAVGAADDVRASYPDAAIVDEGDRLIVPGFVDAHVHFPQVDMIASPGLELLDWLENYTFHRGFLHRPAHRQWSDHRLRLLHGPPGKRGGIVPPGSRE